MTVKEAEKLLKKAYSNGNLTEEDKFELTEALAFLIEETHDPEYMMNLGGIYYEDQQFNLALKYYEMAAGYDYDVAYECLGYIWYYGRTGEVDYKKAYEYFSKAAEVGNVVASYKLADMYRDGKYVEMDYDKYCRTIESLYPRVKYSDWLNDPLPEISMRLARIRKEQGMTDEAVELLLNATENCGCVTSHRITDFVMRSYSGHWLRRSDRLETLLISSTAWIIQTERYSGIIANGII